MHHISFVYRAKCLIRCASGHSTYEMGVLDLLHDLDVVELDVEILVDALEGALQLYIVLELNGDLMVDEGLEKAAF